MRLIHTSDWHLGRLFHRASLLDEQALAMSRLVEIVRSEGVVVDPESVMANLDDERRLRQDASS